MEANHFLLLSCSLEICLLVEWFSNYSTRRQYLIFLSSLIVLFAGYLLDWGNYFREKIYPEYAIVRGGGGGGKFP